MPALFDTIQRLVATGQYLIGQHATERLKERDMLEWQIVDGIDSARLISERPKTEPNPTIQAEQQLADGTPVVVVWAYMRAINTAKLVTVHFFDEML